MSLLVGHLVCALLTWLALVAEGMHRPTPGAFCQALRADIRLFGAARVFLWFLLCLVCWWAVWFARLTDWLEPRR